MAGTLAKIADGYDELYRLKKPFLENVAQFEKLIEKWSVPPKSTR